MPEHELWLGQELVIAGHTRLTILVVEPGEVLLSITAAEPSDVEAPEACQRRHRLTARPVPRASDTSRGNAGG